jgi:hypothetical protein
MMLCGISVVFKLDETVRNGARVQSAYSPIAG